jgi:hypothetical protein
MKRGDLVKLRDMLKHSSVLIYTDSQIAQLEANIYLENFSFNLNISEQQQVFMHFDESAIILELKDIYKDGDGIDVLWGRFVKIITSNGNYGWIQRSYLTKVFK